MPTRTEVEQAIIAINDNGNNTAVEMRDVLTKLLDYAENDTQTTSLNPFHFKTKSLIKGLNGASLRYSFSGLVNKQADSLKGQFVNLTFRLKITDNVKENKFVFALQQDHSKELFDIVQKILNKNKSLTFALPISVVINNKKLNIPFSTNVFFDKQIINTGSTSREIHSICFDINPYSFTNSGSETLLTNAEVISSISFHAPSEKF